MRTFTLLLLHHCLTSTVEASAIGSFNFRRTLPGGETLGIAQPHEETSQSLQLYADHSVDVVSKDLDIILPQSRSVSTGISTALGDLVDRQVGDQVLIAGITAVKEIFVAACTAGPLTCFIVCATAVILGYMAFRVATNDNPSFQGGTFTPTRRSIDGSKPTERVMHIFSDYLPTDGCGLACQLHNKVDEGKWTHIANVTVDGTFHELHHFRNGSTVGMRARQRASKTNSRRDPYDQEDFESVVADYYWNFGTEQAYDDFHSNSNIDNNAGNAVGSYMVNNNYIAACVDFVDNSGLLDDGVVAVGWNEQPYIWDSQSQLDSQISECNIGNVEHGGILPGPTETVNLS